MGTDIWFWLAVGLWAPVIPRCSNPMKTSGVFQTGLFLFYWRVPLDVPTAAGQSRRCDQTLPSAGAHSSRGPHPRASVESSAQPCLSADVGRSPAHQWTPGEYKQNARPPPQTCAPVSKLILESLTFPTWCFPGNFNFFNSVFPVTEWKG